MPAHTYMKKMQRVQGYVDNRDLENNETGQKVDQPVCMHSDEGAARGQLSFREK